MQNNKSKVKIIIFDWDDVFTLGSTTGYFRCYHKTLRDLGVKLNKQEEYRRIMSKWGKTHREELKALLVERPELLDNACEIYESKLFGDVFVDSLKIISNCTKFLNKLKNKYIIYIVTGVHPKILKERIIPKFKVPNVFKQIISTYDIKDAAKQKPHPYIVYEILKKEKAVRDEAVVVGDSKSDVMMAQAAGVRPIVVLTGHLDRKHAKELGVKDIIKNVTHLQEVLKKIK
jgi:phosphoglycolate phosphatase